MTHFIGFFELIAQKYNIYLK